MNIKLLDAIEDQLATYLAAKKREIASRHSSQRGPHKPRCTSCGLTIRGPNHAKGWDHQHRAGK